MVADLVCLGGFQNTGLDSKAKLDMLFRAITARRWETALHLLQRLADIVDINDIDQYGDSLLSKAVMAKADTEFIKRLLDSGANVQLPLLSEGWTPLK
jgi:hypothetical protein